MIWFQSLILAYPSFEAKDESLKIRNKKIIIIEKQIL